MIFVLPSANYFQIQSVSAQVVISVCLAIEVLIKVPASIHGSLVDIFHDIEKHAVYLMLSS